MSISSRPVDAQREADAFVAPARSSGSSFDGGLAYTLVCASPVLPVSTGKAKLAQEICTELTVHATIEEEIFYPACKEVAEDDLEHEAYVEHDAPRC